MGQAQSSTIIDPLCCGCHNPDGRHANALVSMSPIKAKRGTPDIYPHRGMQPADNRRRSNEVGNTRKMTNLATPRSIHDTQAGWNANGQPLPSPKGGSSLNIESTNQAKPGSRVSPRGDITLNSANNISMTEHLGFALFKEAKEIESCWKTPDDKQQVEKFSGFHLKRIADEQKQASMRGNTEKTLRCTRYGGIASTAM
jgi:hypothetical protein